MHVVVQVSRNDLNSKQRKKKKTFKFKLSRLINVGSKGKKVQDTFKSCKLGSLRLSTETCLSCVRIISEEKECSVPCFLHLFVYQELKPVSALYFFIYSGGALNLRLDETGVSPHKPGTVFFIHLFGLASFE